jgi:transcriptional regulator with XRE-family HTH domain
MVNREELPLAKFLQEIMKRRKRLPSQLGADLGVSHSTILRLLSGKDIPNTKSCQKLAAYTGISLEKILAIAGHIPGIAEGEPHTWPEFRDYAQQKYPNELDDDMITMIEDLIERRRRKGYDQRKNK